MFIYVHCKTTLIIININCTHFLSTYFYSSFCSIFALCFLFLRFAFSFDMIFRKPSSLWHLYKLIYLLTLAKFAQDMSYLREKKYLLQQWWMPCPLLLVATNKSGQEKFRDCLKATVLKQWFLHFVDHVFSHQRASLQNLGPFGQLLIFLKFPPYRVRFSDLYPDLLYKFIDNIPTLADLQNLYAKMSLGTSFPKGYLPFYCMTNGICCTGSQNQIKTTISHHKALFPTCGGG